MKSFKFKFRYIDDVLSFNNSEFGDFVHHIYPTELEIKDTTDRARSASYLDLHLEIDNVLRMNLYDESNHCNFPIMNLLFICGNIPEAPAYMEYTSRSCSDISDLMAPIMISLLEHWLLTRKLLNQGFLVVKLKSSL